MRLSSSEGCNGERGEENESTENGEQWRDTATERRFALLPAALSERGGLAFLPWGTGEEQAPWESQALQRCFSGRSLRS